MNNESLVEYNLSSTFTSTVSSVAGNGSTDTPITSQGMLYEKYCPEATMVDKFVTPYIYAIGFPGNILALMIWLQRRMRNSSGYYLAALSLADLIFLSLQIIYELNEKWHVKCLDVKVICEMYPIFFLTSQYLSPLLVLAFTVERYISICHPFARERMCTTRRAKIVIVCLTIFSLLLNAIQGYFWTFDSKYKVCSLRKEVTVNDDKSFWSIWTWCVEAVVFLLVPLLILFFNILVIIEAKRLSKYERRELQSRSQKNSATTVMLLAVSFYQIFTTLPVTIVVTLFYSFLPGDLEVLSQSGPDAAWQRHFNYMFVKIIIEEIGLTHYACNFYIYLITGKIFRQEFKRLICSKVKSALPNITTEYTSLRGSVRQNSKPSVTVRLTNGHIDEKVDGDTETNV